MDWAWANALSPVAVVLMGWWIKNSQENRAARLIDATAKAKIAADGAAALARENLSKAVELVDSSKRIETKVDGRMTKMTDDLAIANEVITKMSVDNATFQGRLLRMLDNPADVRSAVRAIEAEGAPEAPKADTMTVDWTQKG